MRQWQKPAIVLSAITALRDLAAKAVILPVHLPTISSNKQLTIAASRLIGRHWFT